MMNAVLLTCLWAFTLYLSFFFELKLTADFQARMGPSRMGLAGFGFPFANFARLLFSSQERGWKKEDFDLFAATFFFSLSVAVSPLLADEMFLSEPIGIPVCLMSFFAAVVFFSRIRTKGVFKFLNHAQFLVGLLVVVTAVLALGVQDAGLSWIKRPERGIVDAPVLALGYLACLAGGFLLLFEQPFNSLKGEVGVSGYRKLLYEIYRRSLLLYWIVISTLIFMGGFRQGIEASSLEYLRDTLIVFFSATAMFLILVWVSQSQVALRTDQSTRVAVRYVFPMAVFVLFATILLRFQWV